MRAADRGTGGSLGGPGWLRYMGRLRLVVPSPDSCCSEWQGGGLWGQVRLLACRLSLTHSRGLQAPFWLSGCSLEYLEIKTPYLTAVRTSSQCPGRRMLILLVFGCSFDQAAGSNSGRYFPSSVRTSLGFASRITQQGSDRGALAALARSSETCSSSTTLQADVNLAIGA